nr:peroxiredoxin [Dehalococcoidia bacterium]
MPVTLEAGDSAPDFDLPDQDGVRHRLSDYRGQTVVLYFYPKDDTPGCTKEACSFRDNELAIRAAGAQILGVSADSAASHQRFRAKHDLPFPLLVDANAEVSTSYGAWGEKVLYGRIPGYRLSALGEQMAVRAAEALVDRDVSVVI